MALIADGQQAIVGDVRAAIPRGIDPAGGELGGLDALRRVAAEFGEDIAPDAASAWG